MQSRADIVLILGSGPCAPRAADWPKACFSRIVAINNAWRIRPDWDDLIFPEDFPPSRRPAVPGPAQRFIEAKEFIPAQNAHGGVVFAGGTMAFTTGYWALHALRPRVLAFMGCDMVYPETGPTHFYGTGKPDPLRADVTLQDLGAKAARLGLLAACQGCVCVNLSDGPSILPYERMCLASLGSAAAAVPACHAVRDIRARESALGYEVPSGRYWEVAADFDAEALSRIDTCWRGAWAAARARSRAA